MVLFATGTIALFCGGTDVFAHATEIEDALASNQAYLSAHYTDETMGMIIDENTYSLPDVAEGNTFEIILDAHGGTAYSWSYEINPNSGIEYVTMEYVPKNNDSDQNGGGQLIYTFKAIKTGSYKIRFELQISWESEPPIETNVYEITVVK